MEICRKNLDWPFLHTCSDCDISFQALLHHTDFTDIDDLWSVICFPNVKTSVHFETIARVEFLVSEILRLDMLRIRLWKARKISRTKFLS